jgi:hypothetical protein
MVSGKLDELHRELAPLSVLPPDKAVIEFEPKDSFLGVEYYESFETCRTSGSSATYITTGTSAMATPRSSSTGTFLPRRLVEAVRVRSPLPRRRAR